MTPFRRLETENKAVYVVDQILTALDDGTYTNGDKLPSEKVIAQETGISRPSVREAIGVLRFVGILETRVGDGSYVKRVIPNVRESPSVVSRIRSLLEGADNPFEALEARRTLETNLVREAAVKRVSDDLASMEDALEEGAVAVREMDCDRLLVSDLRFHRCIGKACQNIFLNQMLSSLLEIMESVLWKDVKRQLLETGAPSLGLIQNLHRRILDGIVASDADSAQRAMQDHFDAIEELFD